MQIGVRMPVRGAFFWSYPHAVTMESQFNAICLTALLCELVLSHNKANCPRGRIGDLEETTMLDALEIGYAVKDRRALLGLTQAQVAEAAGVSKRCLWSIELGRNPGSSSTSSLRCSGCSGSTSRSSIPALRWTSRAQEKTRRAAWSRGFLRLLPRGAEQRVLRTASTRSPS